MAARSRRATARNLEERDEERGGGGAAGGTAAGGRRQKWGWAAASLRRDGGDGSGRREDADEGAATADEGAGKPGEVVGASGEVDEAQLNPHVGHAEMAACPRAHPELHLALGQGEELQGEVWQKGAK